MRPRGREGTRVPRGVTWPGARLSWSSTASSRWGPGGGCFVRVLVFGGLVFLFLFFFFLVSGRGIPGSRLVPRRWRVGPAGQTRRGSSGAHTKLASLAML